ncbi:hypothetical protein JW859_06985 [bacterium]|nr:hypothetical protein [bacterium]
MKTEREIFLERIDEPQQVGAVLDWLDKPELGQAVAENRALKDLARIKTPAPNRQAMIRQAARAVDVYGMNGTPVAPPLRIVRRPRWMIAAAASVAVLLVAAVVVLSLPQQTLSSRHGLRLPGLEPAWAAEPGFVINQDLGPLATDDARGLRSQVEEIARDVLKKHGGAPAKLNGELKNSEDGYSYSLALPGLKRDAAEEIREQLVQAFNNRISAEIGGLDGELEDAMFLLEGTGSPDAWRQMDSLPDPLLLDERFQTLLAENDGNSNVQIDVSKVGNQVMLQVNSDEDLDFSGPLGDYDGREVLELRESSEGDETGSYHVSRNESFNQSFSINGQEVSPAMLEGVDLEDLPEFMREMLKKNGKNGTCSYSMQMSSSSSSSSSHSSQKSSSSSSQDGSSRATGGGGGGGNCGGGGGGGGSCGGGGGGGANGSPSDSSGNQTSSSWEEYFDLPNGGKGARGGGSGSASGSGGDSGSGGSRSTSSSGENSGSGEIPEFTMPDFNAGQQFPTDGPYAEHYKLLEQYIDEHFAGQQINKMSTSSSGDCLEVEITSGEASHRLQIKPDESGNLAVLPM